MTSYTKGSKLMTGLKWAVVAAAVFPILSSCSDIEAASDAFGRAGHRASFVQVPFIASTSAPGRVLEMQVFSGSSGSVPRASKIVKFHAQLQP